VLSDILGDEDHLGDMDFKVAGTEDGITALQMDIKINGITTEIMKVALEQAKGGRQHILEKMAETIKENRSEVNKNAPRIITIQIDKEKIGALIGPGGKNIKDICERTGAKIDIQDDGTVNVATLGGESGDEALRIIQESVAEAEVGKIYEGKVTKLLDFGGLVNFLGKLEGLVHISEIKKERVEAVTDVINEGDEVKVKVISVDRGKVRLSMKRVDQETGEDLSDQFDDDGSAPRGNSRRDRDGGKGRKDRRGGNDRNRSEGGNNNNSDNDSGGNRKKRFF
jgi:polyribonucleotide nucleotidyltransferase